MTGGLLLVCSSGGHLLQLHELRGAWEPFNRTWVTFDKSDARSMLRDERVIHAFGPTNRNVPLPAQVPKLTDIKVINYDFAKYGASDTRKRLLERWEKEVNSGK